MTREDFVRECFRRKPDLMAGDWREVGRARSWLERFYDRHYNGPKPAMA